MNFWRNSILVKLTLLFFTVMLLYNPAYAEQLPLNISSGVSHYQDKIPITYVDESEVDQLIWELQRKGYVVREGTLAQLEQLVQADDTSKTVDEPGEAKDTNKDSENNNEENTEKDKKDQPCEKQVKSQERNNSQDQVTSQEEKRSQQQGQSQHQKKSGDQVGDKAGAEKPALENSVDCNKEKAETGSEQQDQNKNGSPEVATEPEPEPTELPPPPPQPTATVQPSVSVHADVSYGSQGGSSDAAKVFFLLIGFVVVAAFVVYAGKYAYDIATGKDHKLWWELIFNSTFMDTEPRQHGHFLGAKIATGFVSNELIQLALVGEVGNADVNLVLNEYFNPQVLNFSASYWMLGGAARMHLTDKMVNASYLYMELLGGTTSNSATDTIGAARFGASFGINDNVRLGASIGAQYIGLNEEQGFVNDGDDYWFTLGLEIGARF
jgi:hypothetical protein